jgi:hypothetical protein
VTAPRFSQARTLPTCALLRWKIPCSPSLHSDARALLCFQPTHFNYNSDQLLKIFHLVGTPTESDMLAKMQCLKHFQGWPKHRVRALAR